MPLKHQRLCLGRGIGEPDPIPPDAIDRLYDRYQNVYGQR